MPKKKSQICNIKTHQQEKGLYHIELSKKTFKDRWYKHKLVFFMKVWSTPLNFRNSYGIARKGFRAYPYVEYS